MSFSPPEELRGKLVTLRRYRLSDADAVKAAIAVSLDNLRGWMPWAQSPPTRESVMAYIEPASRIFGGDAEASYAITLAESGEYVGSCGLMPRIGPGALEIGYWVSVEHVGKGYATEAAQLCTEAGLSLPGIERVEIHCDEANVVSAKVPRRLGYRLDRTEEKAISAPRETGRSMVWIKERLAG